MSASIPDRLHVADAAWKLDETTDGPPFQSPGHIEDASLMRRIQDGDEQALARVFDRYSGIVFEIGRQILRDTGEAEELVQEVFLNVYRRCRSFDASKGTLRGWLRRIAYREAFDRKDYLNNRRFYDSNAVEGLIEEIRSVFDVEREADAHQMEALLRSAMETLNERQRSTLELSLFDGYTLREISELQQDSLVQTRHHYYRALDRLRKSLPLKALRTRTKGL